MIKVLVVDNFPDVGAMLSGILADAGYQAQAVQSANEALKVLFGMMDIDFVPGMLKQAT